MNTVINDKVHDYYWNHDLNCAITTLKILSEIFCTELHPQIIEAAFGLNAGRCGSQCGLVEGTLMFIGVYGSQNSIARDKVKDLCNNFSNGFQQQFGNLLCRELRPQGLGANNPPHLCENTTKLAIAFAANFISKACH